MNKKLSALFILIILAGFGYMWLQNSKAGPPGGGAVPPMNAPAARQEEPRKPVPNEQKEGKGNTVHKQIELPEEVKQTYDSQAKAQGFNESMRREEKKAIKITPGVDFQPGKGVSIKVPGGEEKVQVRRDSTYRSDEVKVEWEKKF
jgi:hypothetical protein